MGVLATAADFAAFAGVDAPEQVERMIDRATEVVLDRVLVPFDVDADDLPTDSTVAVALRDAVCAQVEYWVQGVAENSDVVGQRGSLSMPGFSGRAPRELAPRAARILRQAALAGPVLG